MIIRVQDTSPIKIDMACALCPGNAGCFRSPCVFVGIPIVAESGTFSHTRKEFKGARTAHFHRLPLLKLDPIASEIGASADTQIAASLLDKGADLLRSCAIERVMVKAVPSARDDQH